MFDHSFMSDFRRVVFGGAVTRLNARSKSFGSSLASAFFAASMKRLYSSVRSRGAWDLRGIISCLGSAMRRSLFRIIEEPVQTAIMQRILLYHDSLVRSGKISPYSGADHISSQDRSFLSAEQSRQLRNENNRG